MDQYRGYAIFGMILVNYLGMFPAMPEILKHHKDFMSYADTIAPIFIFVAGMGFRLSLMRNIERFGVRKAYWTALKRYLTLTLIGILFYAPLNWKGWWDALVDIGLGGILALPFIARPASIRIAAATGYLLLYQALLSWTGYETWVMAHSYDGGPLGPLSWVAILLFGTIAQDILMRGGRWQISASFLAWGIFLSVLGWTFRAQWGSLKPFWPFSQTSMSTPYTLFSTGIAFLSFLPFYWLSDLRRINLPTLTIMGTNPLVIYLIQGALCEMHGTIIPEESRPAIAILGFIGFYYLCYAVARYLYNNKMFVKL